MSYTDLRSRLRAEASHEAPARTGGLGKRIAACGGVLAAVALAVAGCGGSATVTDSSNAAQTSSAPSGSDSAKTIVGAGSTLVSPLLDKWAGDYQKRTGVALTYGAIGSGGGISAITGRTVDFGASDAPLTPDQARAAKGVLQIPWALAATLVAYHVEGVSGGLHLDGSTLTGIYLGKITSWNDPAIARLNPDAKLPDLKITPVYRSDGSGDTYAFTDYLSHISPEWKSEIGTSTQVSFPAGIGGKGNDGVAGALQSTNGTIAYIAVSYVLANQLDYAEVENRAGRYPKPSVRSIAAAAATVSKVPADNAVSIVDPPASQPDAYPISTFTYALVPRHSAKAAALRRFLAYAIGDGQQFAGALTFARLPAAILRADRATIARIGG